MKDAYSDLKLAWLSTHLRRLRAGKLCAPCHVQLHLSGACNLRCRWCTYDGGVERLARPAKHIPATAAAEFIHDFWELGGRAVEFTGGGEPTQHPDFEFLLDRALHRGLDCALITNGLVPKPAALSAYIPSLSWLRVSLDASTAEEYAERKRPRDPAAWDKVIAFIQMAARERRKGTVGLSYLIGPWTRVGEVGRAVGLARATGVDSIRFAPAYTEGQDSGPRNGTVCAVALAAEDNPGFVIDMCPQRREDMGAASCHPHRRCGYMHTSFVVGCDAGVYPCCFQVYDEKQKLTDLRNTSFRSWWYSSRRAEVLKNWDRAERCQGVACWMRKKNEAFYQLVEDEPRDLYFV